MPRDLVGEPMKGGAEPAAMFARIRLGMPGTPHPALVAASDLEVIDLVHFCLSLRRGPPRLLTNFERGQRGQRRARIAAFAGHMAETAEDAKK